VDVVIANPSKSPWFWFHLGNRDKAQLTHFHSPNAIFLRCLHVDAGGHKDMRESFSQIAGKENTITFFQLLIEALTVHIELDYE
jgi:hypothetical protein